MPHALQSHRWSTVSTGCVCQSLGTQASEGGEQQRAGVLQEDIGQGFMAAPLAQITLLLADQHAATPGPCIAMTNL